MRTASAPDETVAGLGQVAGRSAEASRVGVPESDRAAALGSRRDATWPGAVGRVRDALVRPMLSGVFNKAMLGSLNGIRAQVGVPPVGSADEFVLRPPLMLVATAQPFDNPRPDWDDSIQLIGACAFDPAPAAVPEWLAAIERPIVLVSTSSERQADIDMARMALTALPDEPVHVVATFPAGCQTE